MSGAPPGESPVYRRRTHCRACDGTALDAVLSLGDQPLANAFLAPDAAAAPELRVPLDLYVCSTCGLVQLLDVVDPEVLFRDYIYVTGTSETIAEHNRGYAASVVATLGAGAGDLIVEAASNDGSLLSCFQSHGVRVLGVEPARNIAAIARARGVPTIDQFFNTSTARAVRSDVGPARAVLGNNVLAHVDDPADFLAGARELLTPDGIVVVEVPYARDMHERGEYDTIYHEHLCYFAVSPLARLGERVGLRVRSVERVSVHGGSIRVTFDQGSDHGAGPQAFMREEQTSGLTSVAAWRAFGAAAEVNRAAVRAYLAELHARGRRVVGYGAPAKGNTLLNYCGIGVDLLPWTVDRNPMKVGRLTPGMHLPTRPVEALLEEQPDDVLILAWNFADEIVRQQAEYRRRGGRFHVPIPMPHEV